MLKILISAITFLVNMLNKLSTKRYDEARALDARVQSLAVRVIKTSEEGRVAASLASKIESLLK